jgi:hypothetical protein
VAGVQLRRVTHTEPKGKCGKRGHFTVMAESSASVAACPVLPAAHKTRRTPNASSHARTHAAAAQKLSDATLKRHHKELGVVINNEQQAYSAVKNRPALMVALKAQHAVLWAAAAR